MKVEPELKSCLVKEEKLDENITEVISSKSAPEISYSTTKASENISEKDFKTEEISEELR